MHHIDSLHSSDIQHFVETQVCKPCTIHRSVATDQACYWVCVLMKVIGRRLALELACTKVNRVMLINLRAEYFMPVFQRDNI